jgi:hypothetical protein
MIRVGKLKNNQTGFSAVEAFLILIIIAIVGGTGWYVWHAKQTADKSLSSSAITSPTFEKKTATTVPPQASSKTYLTIKEWGIKVKLGSADPSIISYTLLGPTNTEEGDKLADAAQLSLTSSVTTNTECQSLGIIIQRSSTKLSDRPNQQQVGNYWYDVGGSPSSCGDTKLDAIRTQYTANTTTWTYLSEN